MFIQISRYFSNSDVDLHIHLLQCIVYTNASKLKLITLEVFQSQVLNLILLSTVKLSAYKLKILSTQKLFNMSVHVQYLSSAETSETRFTDFINIYITP